MQTRALAAGGAKREEDLNYFVTGATGFIGRHLIEELLKREGTIYALVREGSRGRLDDALAGARRGRPHRARARRPLEGGPRHRGLRREDRPLLPPRGVYDMAADEETMMNANVEGTRHVVEFVNSHDVGRFHHTSLDRGGREYKGLFREDMFDEGQKLPHAYHRIEVRVGEARARRGRVPLRVYRPASWSATPQTGEMDKIDGPYYFFKLLQRLRHALPEWFPLAGPEGRNANLVPVDFVARRWTTSPTWTTTTCYGDTFHLVDPEPLSVGAVAERVRQGGARAAVRDADRLEPDRNHPEAGTRGPDGGADGQDVRDQAAAATSASRRT